MKKLVMFILILNIIMINTSCQNDDKGDITLPTNDTRLFNERTGDQIPIINVTAPYSKINGYLEAFSKYQKSDDEFYLTFISSSLKTHQLFFELNNISPISKILFFNGSPSIKNISIEISLNGIKYKRILNNYELNNDLNEINLENQKAKYIKFIFDTNENYQIKDIKFILGEGFIVKERTDYFDALYNYEGFNGADGIFSFNLNGDSGFNSNSNKLFIFSDTYIGSVYPHNNIRRQGIIINNSLGYLNTNQELKNSITYDYSLDLNNNPQSVFKPFHYLGYKLGNLLDGNGLSISYDKNALLTNLGEGSEYLTNGNESEFIVDFKDNYHVDNLYLWNFNEIKNYGAKEIEIYGSLNNLDYELLLKDNLNLASGSNNESFSNLINISKETRYLKIIIKNDQEKIGLGKLIFFDQNDNFLFGEISGSEDINDLTENELTGRLWLQDGVIINNYLYLYPILVKDVPGLFKVYQVGLIKVPIINEKIDYENAIYYNTPLQIEDEDGTIYFGAGILNNINIDGYIYLYGYKDNDQGRNLISARFLPDDILNFNNYQYFDGTNYQCDIKKVALIKNDVSAELSVSYIKEGYLKDKYMLVVMENTTSGKISYATSNNPYGPFSDYELVYQTTEHTKFKDTFTYNAKLHDSLSKDGNYIITYNVNSTKITNLVNALIYYPRFIELKETKKEKN